MKPRHIRDQVSSAVSQIRKSDNELSDELWRRARSGEFQNLRTSIEGILRAEVDLAAEGMDEERILETVVHVTGRPVLAIQDGGFKAEFTDAESMIWKKRLEDARTLLFRAIPSVGRVELSNHPRLSWAGTGWMVAEGILVTNRHVASYFGVPAGDRFVFKPGVGVGMEVGARIDFLEEYQRTAAAEFPVTEVLWIEPDAGPDIAFVRLSGSSEGKALPRPIGLADGPAEINEQVAAIGYPARDSRIPDQDVVLKIFGDVYDKKRLAPGQIGAATAKELQHDCSTLGGNSGSVLLSLRTGEAVGLHYAGLYLQANFAVPAALVRQRLREVQQGRRPLVVVEPDRATAAGAAHAATAVVADGQGATWTIPLHVTVQFGSPVAAAGAAPLAAGGPQPPRDRLERALHAAQRATTGREDVLQVRLGYRFRDGWITDERVVVIVVRQKLSPTRLRAAGIEKLPGQFDGVGVDVTSASAMQILERSGLQLPWQLEAVRRGSYQPPQGIALRRVNERMKAIVHVSPDAGFPQLEQFLGRVQQSLTVGIYEFTADYIFDELLDAVKASPRKLNLVAQRFKSNAKGQDEIEIEKIVEQLEGGLGRRFRHAWASVSGPDRLFASAYHIKVAVRDHKEFWLSSGNWKPSGQPKADPAGTGDRSTQLLRSKNREWHAIIENQALADQFEKFLLHDLEQAKDLESVAIEVPDILVPESMLEPVAERRVVPPRYFSPLSVDKLLDVEPLLTPDNYVDKVIELVESAREKLYVQNQSLSPLEQNEAQFQRLLGALRGKQRDSLDVRIIFRDASEFGGPARLREALEKLKDFGFDVGQVRVQRGCHTKGIIVDGKAALLGSHNWTNEGTLYNRDASLIFRDSQVAQYLEQIFLFDWEYLAKQEIDEGRGPIELASGAETPQGMVRLPITELFG